MSESSAYIVTLRNGAEVRVVSQSWMTAGAEACKKYREENPIGALVDENAYEKGIVVSDIRNDGAAHDMLSFGGEEKKNESKN